MTLRAPDAQRLTADAVTAEVTNSAPETQFPKFGSPGAIVWAQHDTISGHARNALALMEYLLPASSQATVELIQAIERRLEAIVELSRQRFAITHAGTVALAGMETYASVLAARGAL
jgi:hypothetical protein